MIQEHLPLLKRLEAKKFVIRKRLATDERVVVVSLTTKGKELKNKAVVPTQILCKMDLKTKDTQDLQNRLDDLLKKLSL